MNCLDRMQARAKSMRRETKIPSLPKCDFTVLKKNNPIQAFMEDRNYDDSMMKKVEWTSGISMKSVRDQMEKEQPMEFIEPKDVCRTTYVTAKQMGLTANRPYDGYFDRRKEDESVR